MESLNSGSGFLKTEDGNYLFLYWRDDDPPIQNNILTHALAKYNTEGELLWEKTYDQEVSGVTNQPRGIMEMEGGNVVIVGRYFGGVPFSSTTTIHLVNSNGDSLLYRAYPQYENFTHITKYNNEVLLVTAWGVNNDYSIIKIDVTTGDILEEFPTLLLSAISFQTFYPNYSDHYYHFNTFSDSIRLEKYNYSQQLITSNEIPFPEGFGFANSGDVEIIGNHDGDGIAIYNNAILEFDNNLNPLLEVPFTENSLSVSTQLMSDHKSSSITPTEDGGYIISGAVAHWFPETATVFFIKINSLGEEEWSKWYSNWDLPANLVPYIVEEPDGYVFIMQYLADGTIYLVKMTKTGQLVGTNDFFELTPLKVYPNPCEDYIKIDHPTNLDNITVNIINAQGQIVQQEYNIQASDQISMSHLETGIYFVQILNEEGLPLSISKVMKK